MPKKAYINPRHDCKKTAPALNLIYQLRHPFFKAKKYFRKSKLVRPNFDNGQVVLRPNHHMYQICDLTA